MTKNIYVDLKDYEKICKIGKGAFGEVFKVKKRNSDENCLYAAKISLNAITEKSPIIQDLISEINIISKINHPSIIKFIGFSKTDFDNNPNPVIITDYVSNGSLESCIQLSIKSQAPEKYDDTHKLIILYGIAAAMSFLHKNEIIHRDLKPDNILLDDKMYPKVCDFGLSKVEKNGDKTKILKGTPYFMSPEIIKDLNYSNASDVYAFAIIVYMVILNKMPYTEENIFALQQKVTSGERPEIDGCVIDSYKQLIEKCWAQNPSERFTFEEIANDLKENPEFITDLVDQGDFYDYVDYVDEYSSFFDKDAPEISQADFETEDPNKVIEIAKQLRFGIGVAKDLMRARELYKKAAVLGNVKGMVYYAQMCQNGEGGPADLAQAVEYFKKAADENERGAQFKYGLMLEHGNEYVEKNVNEAVKYYKASADQQNPRAMLNYVRCLTKGIGIKKNIKEALNYCKSASKNSETKKNAIKMYEQLLKQVNDDVNDENNFNSNPNTDFNLIEKTVTFNGRQYQYDQEYVYSGNSYKINFNKNDNYPQGEQYCKKLVQNQQKNNGILIVLKKNNPTTWFYFPCNNINDLNCNYGQRVIGSDNNNNSEFQVEIDYLDRLNDRNIFPQGKEYCKSLLTSQKENKNERKSFEQKEKNCILILSRVTPNHKVWYYFKSKYLTKHCPRSWEEDSFFDGTEKLEEALKMINEKKQSKDNEFPQSIKYCTDLVKDQIQKNGSVFVFTTWVYKIKRDVYHFYPSSIIFSSFADEERWAFNKESVQKELQDLLDREKVENLPPIKNFKVSYPQGKEYCINLIQEQLANSGKIHVLMRKSNYSSNVYFYFKYE